MSEEPIRQIRNDFEKLVIAKLYIKALLKESTSKDVSIRGLIKEILRLESQVKALEELTQEERKQIFSTPLWKSIERRNDDLKERMVILNKENAELRNSLIVLILKHGI